MKGQSWYNLAGQIQKRTAIQELAEDVLDAPEPPVSFSHEPLAEITSEGSLEIIRRWILRSVALIASMSCAATSVYFSNKWFVDSQPRVIAAVMSVTVVMTLTVSPELSIALARKRRWVTAVMIAAISAMATVFSMGSTIGGIYNARTEVVEAVAVQMVSQSDPAVRAAVLEVELLRERAARLQEALQTDQESVASYQAYIDQAIQGGEDPASRSVALFVANRNYAITRANAARSGLEAVEADIRALAPLLAQAEIQEQSSTVARRDNFNLWLGSRFGLTEDQMEFVLAVFPAVFIDLIAPVMLVVAFGL